MAIALVASGGQGLGANGGTSASADTGSGVSLLVVAISFQSVSSAPVLSDDKGNSFTQAVQSAPSGSGVRLYHAASPTTGAGHSFTVSGGSTFTSVAWLTFSGTDTLSPLGTTATASVGGTPQASITPGPLSLSVGDVAVTAVAGFTTASVTINESFTETSDIAYVASTYYPLAMAYKISGTTSENPTWTFATSQTFSNAVIAGFKLDGGGTPPPRRSHLMLLGVG